MRLTVPLTLAAAAALSALVAFWWQRRAESTPRAAAAPATISSAAAHAPVSVDTLKIVTEPFQVQIQATGTLLPRESVELVSELSRRLLRVRAEEGSNVKRGQVLFDLDASDLNAELGKLQVQLRLAEATLDRKQKLLNEGIATRQELDNAQAEVDAAEAQRRALAVTLTKTVIRAPFAGKLGLRRVSEGAWLTPSTVLATLQDTATLKLDFTLPERYSGLVSLGMEFTFSTAGRAERFQGKVVATEPTVDKTTRSMLLRGLVEGRSELLPGTFVTVEIPMKTEQAILVPSIAVIPGVDGRRVFVADNGVARSVAVEVGARTADRAQILSGLKAGDQLVVSNLLRVRDGLALAPSNQRQP